MSYQCHHYALAIYSISSNGTEVCQSEIVTEPACQYHWKDQFYNQIVSLTSGFHSLSSLAIFWGSWNILHLTLVKSTLNLPCKLYLPYCNVGKIKIRGDDLIQDNRHQIAISLLYKCTPDKKKNERDESTLISFCTSWEFSYIICHEKLSCLKSVPLQCYWLTQSLVTPFLKLPIIFFSRYMEKVIDESLFFS